MYLQPTLRTEGQSSKLEAEVCKRVGEILNKHYPGHPWKVEVDFNQGIAKFQIPLFMGATNWYIIPLRHLRSDMQDRVVRNLAGECLERYRIPASGFRLPPYMDALSNIPAHRRGYHGFVPS